MTDTLATIKQTEADLAAAEHAAANADASKLASAGGLLAGLRARLDGLRQRKAQEDAEAAKAAAAKAEKEKAAAIAALHARQAELVARLGAWPATLFELEKRANAVWADYGDIQQAIADLAADGQRLGIGAPPVLAPWGNQTDEHLRLIQRGASPVKWWAREAARVTAK
jgi:chromosome segregation ATPase